MGIIYKVTNTINDKVYIGQSTRTLEERRYEHEKSAFEKFTKFLFHRALRKYGKNAFIWEVVEECAKNDLCIREQLFIKECRSFIGFDDCIGYNMTLGGDGGNTNGSHPNKSEIYEKISRGNSGDNHYLAKMQLNEYENYLNTYRRGENNPMYGYVYSNEQLKKMSVCQSGENNGFYGKKHSDSSKESMRINGKGKLTGNKNPNFGKKGKDNHRTKRYVIILPSLDSFIVYGLSEFIEWYKTEFNIILFGQCLGQVAKGKNKHHKGIICKHFDEALHNNLSIKEFHHGES